MYELLSIYLVFAYKGERCLNYNITYVYNTLKYIMSSHNSLPKINCFFLSPQIDFTQRTAKQICSNLFDVVFWVKYIKIYYVFT